MGKKKGKKKSKLDLDDFPDYDDDLDPLKSKAPEDAEDEGGKDEAPSPSPMGGKKKKKGKKGKKQQQLFDDDDSDDDLDPLKNAPAQKQESEEEDDDDDDEEDVPAKSGGASGFAALMGGDDEDEDEDDEDDEPVPAKKSSGFAALMMDDDDDDEEEEEEEEDDEPAAMSKPSGFAALMMDEDEEDEEEEDDDDEPAVVSKPSGFAALMFQGGSDSDEDEDTDDDSDSEDGGSFFSVPLVTGKVLSTEDHPKADKLKVCEIDAGDRTYQIVTSAKNVKKGRRVALARPGCVVPQSGVRIEKSDMRGVESEGMVLSTYDLNWEDEKSKKAAILPKKWKAGHDVPKEMPDELKSPEEGQQVDLSVFDTEKKKKKSKKDKSKDSPAPEEGSPDPMDIGAFGKKKKKSKKDKKKADSSADAMEKLSIEEKEPEPEPEPEPEAAPEEEEESAPAFDVSAFASKGSKKKKNKKKNKKAAAPAADDFDDIDAILAQLDGPVPAQEEAKADPAPAEEPKPEAAEAEDKAEEEPKALTANQKKKLKKKQKEAEKKARMAAEGITEDDSKSPKKEKKGGKPVSAAVKKMQEELEKRKRMEEEQERLEEEMRKKEEEEEARLAKEERIKEEKKRLKKEKERLKKERLKKEGKLLSGKAKEEAKRLAAMREQMLRQAGIVPDSPDAETGVKKKVVYEKKKKRPAKQEEAKVEEKKPEEEAPAKKPEEEVPAVEEAPEEEPAGDWDEVDWETKAEGKSSSTSWVDVQAEGKDGDGEEDSDEYSDSEDLNSDEEFERRIEVARAKRQERYQEAMKNRSKDHLRNPICCILGHVDTGKTKLLDKIRGTNVQDGEAGGITQQIGATFIPGNEIVTRTDCLGEHQTKGMKVPGLLVIDTPGHESFTNLRSRGSGLCDIAILVVDIMHGLEQQTIESLNMLKMRKTPFIIALNKVDRMYDWKPIPNEGFRKTLEAQGEHVQQEFKKRYEDAVLALNQEGMNVALYWENPDIKSYVSIVPTSAITGEGIPDILNLLVETTQKRMVERLMHVEFLQCTVLEVKQIEGLGTTIDVILINGTLRESDTIVVCGLQGPIVTPVRALLTPHPMREMRVKGSYLHHKEIEAAQGVKICANDLEGALAGTPLFVLGPEDDEEHLKDEVVSDVQSILGQVDKSGEGVCVQASTLGSLEALLEFLKSPDVKIPVSGISIGPVHKIDVMKASIMLERKKEYAVILAFDVDVSRDARDMAKDLDIKIFTADIIYHLFDQFTAYMKKVKEDRKKETEMDATFPCVLKILPTCIFNKKDPIVLGVEVLGGIAKVGSPLCVPTQDFVEIGRIASLEKNHKPVDKAYVGDSVAMKVNSTTALEATRMYGRHFDHTDELVSRISRHSIDLLKESYRDELTKEDWQLVLKLKHLFQIQ